MKVQIEEISNVKKKVQVELPAEVVTEKLEQVYKDIGKSAHLKGFRPGKAPRAILERYFGESVKSQVSSELIEESFGKIIAEHDIRAVGQPVVEELDLKPGQDMRFTVTVEVIPHIELKNYKGLEIPQLELRVTDEEVSARIDEIRELFARLEDVEEDRPAQEGDFVVLLSRFRVEGVDRGPGPRQEQVVELKQGSLEERIYRAIIGLRPGQQVQVPYRFEENHPDKKLAGKEGILEIELGKIRKKVVPELDDAFARKLGEYQGIDELKSGIRRELEEAARKKIEVETKEAIVDQLLKLHEFQVPESMVALQIESMVERAEMRLVAQGMKVEDTQALTAQMRERYRDSAVRSVRSSLILQAIAEKEGLEVTEETLRNGMERIARETGRDLSQVERLYEHPKAMESLKESLKEELALDFLRQEAKMVSRKEK